MKGLIIKSKWIKLIFSGKKTWEIRGSNTKIRGTIALIESGAGLIIGTVDLIDVKRLSPFELLEGYKEHLINDLNIIKYKQPYAWILSNPIKYERPNPYKHPQGAVIWVNI